MRLKITTFNTELLETPTVDREGYYQMDDGDRAREIGALLVASGSDVIVLNEVFSNTAKRGMRKALEATHPHSVLEVGDGDAFEQDSGLMLFSRFPFLPLANQRFRPATLDATTSEVAFLELDHGYSMAEALVSQATSGNTLSDALADKGIAVVILDTPIGPLPIAFTHLWASYSTDAVVQMLRKFAMRRRQLASAVALLAAVVPPEQLPLAMFLGDLNVVGNHHADPPPPLPYGPDELIQMCGTTPLMILRGEITDASSFELALPAETRRLLPANPGLIEVLHKIASILAAPRRIGEHPRPITMVYPDVSDSVALRQSGAEWLQNIRRGPIRAQFDDGWSRLYGGIADDLGTTNGGERLDYILVPIEGPKGTFAAGWTVQHMTLAYNLRRGNSGVQTDWGIIGTTSLSDHLGVNAYLAPRSPHCSPAQAREIQLPFDDRFELTDPDAFYWLQLWVDGTLQINPRGGNVDVYHTSDLSIPVRVRASEDVEVVDYRLTAGKYFLRVTPRPGEREGSIEVKQPDGATQRAALHLDPCESLTFPMTPGLPHGNADEVWFKIQTDPSDGGVPQQLHVALNSADPSFSRQYEVTVVSPEREPVAQVKRSSGGFVCGFDHDASRYPVLYVVVKRIDPLGSSFAIRWATNLIVLGGMMLSCVERTPGWGDDEIKIWMMSDTRVVTLGNLGWASAGTFEKGTNPLGLDNSTVLTSAPYVRGQTIEIRMLEDDTGDVFGSEPEIFEVCTLDKSIFNPELRRKQVTLELRYKDQGHYQIKAWLGRRALDLPSLL